MSWDFQSCEAAKEPDDWNVELTYFPFFTTMKLLLVKINKPPCNQHDSPVMNYYQESISSLKTGFGHVVTLVTRTPCARFPAGGKKQKELTDEQKQEIKEAPWW